MHGHTFILLILFCQHIWPIGSLHYAVFMGSPLQYISASFLVVTVQQDETQNHMYARQVQSCQAIGKW